MNLAIYLLKATLKLLTVKVPEALKALKHHLLAARNRSQRGAHSIAQVPHINPAQYLQDILITQFATFIYVDLFDRRLSHTQGTKPHCSVVP